MFDSRIIVEYLERLVPSPVLIPESAELFIKVKRQEALADGIADAAATIFIERKRPTALQSAEWITRQQQKIDLGLAAMSDVLAENSYFVGAEFTLADFMARFAERDSIKQTIA